MSGGASFETSSFKDPKVIIRIVSAFLALVAFSCVANGANKLKSIGQGDLLGQTASEEFFIFVGVLAVLLDICFIVVYMRGDRLPATWQPRLPLIELATSAVWTLFFFAASIALLVNINKIADFNGIVVIDVGLFRAGGAFGLLCFLLWAGSSFLAYKRYRSGASGPTAYSDI